MEDWEGREGKGWDGKGRERKGKLVDLISKHLTTETKTSPSPDPNQYRRCCPDLNARKQKIEEN